MGLTKNRATTATFDLVDKTTGDPLLLATPTSEVRKDAGSLVATATQPIELGGGSYSVPLSAAEMNADVVYVKIMDNNAVPQSKTLVTDTPDTGIGEIIVTVTVETVGNTPLGGVEVWVTTDAVGANRVTGTRYTNDLGQVTFELDAGAYYVWRSSSLYDFVNPYQITVTA